MERVFYEAGFEWDEHNVTKNWHKHRVRFTECEEIFFDERLKLLPDVKHSSSEPRHWALGKTKENRHLFVVFTVRAGKIRVISARDMTKRERTSYGEKIKGNPEI